MATKCTRAVIRQTDLIDHVTHSPWMIELEVGGKRLRMWPKGRRHRYSITLQEVIVHAARIAAEEARREKLARRKERSQARR